jgi:iron complex transport system ATP-binding protein
VVSLGRHPFTNWLGSLTEKDHAIITNALNLTHSFDLKDKEFTHLSDGERQKVMIARALAQEPKILILDEPTAFLDFPHRVEIMRTLKQLSIENDYAIILSTHDLSLAITTADQLLMIDAEGRIDSGSPEDLILEGKFEKTFNPEQKLIFNPYEATFYFNNNQGPEFSISSDNDLLKHWTEKALLRIGFQIQESNSTNLITCKVLPQPNWECAFNGITTQHTSIHSLVKYLRNTFQ